MKKSLSIILILSAFIFYSALNIYERSIREVPLFKDTRITLDSTNLYSFKSVEDNEQFYKDFIAFIDEHDLNVYQERYVNDEIEYYVRTSSPKLMKQVVTKGGYPSSLKEFDTINSQGTTKDTALFYKLNRPKYSINPLSKLLEANNHYLSGPFYIWSDDIEVHRNITNSLNNGVMRQYLPDLILTDRPNTVIGLNDNHNIMKVTMLAIALSLFFVLDDCSEEYSALYLEGKSGLQIFLPRLLKRLVFVPIGAVLYLVFYALFVRLPLSISGFFWKALIVYSIVGLIAMAMTLMLSYFLISEFDTLKTIKKRVVSEFNILVLVVLVLVMSVFIMSTSVFFTSTKDTISMYRRPEYKGFNDYYYILDSGIEYLKEIDDYPYKEDWDAIVNNVVQEIRKDHEIFLSSMIYIDEVDRGESEEFEIFDKLMIFNVDKEFYKLFTEVDTNTALQMFYRVKGIRNKSIQKFFEEIWDERMIIEEINRPILFEYVHMGEIIKRQHNSEIWISPPSIDEEDNYYHTLTGLTFNYKGTKEEAEAYLNSILKKEGVDLNCQIASYQNRYQFFLNEYTKVLKSYASLLISSFVSVVLLLMILYKNIGSTLLHKKKYIVVVIGVVVVIGIVLSRFMFPGEWNKQFYDFLNIV